MTPVDQVIDDVDVLRDFSVVKRVLGADANSAPGVISTSSRLGSATRNNVLKDVNFRATIDIYSGVE